MAKNNGKNVLNLSKVVASPILTGESEKYVWTGVINSKNITPHIISDDTAREEFIKLVKDLEDSVRKYRVEFKMNNNMLYVRKNLFDTGMNVLEQHIKSVSAKIKEWLNNPIEKGLDIDLFWVELCREYETILKQNPNEFKAMEPDARKNLETFRTVMNSYEPCLREIYIPEENRYVCEQFFTIGQEEKYRSTTNIPNLVKVLESVSGKKDLTIDEGKETLKEVVEGVTLADLVKFFPNKRFADMQYVTVFKNYLLKKGYTSEEIENMGQEAIIDKAMESYSKDTINFHSTLLAETILSSLKYIDLEKLLLIAMVRPIKTFEMMTPKVDKTDEMEVDPLKSLQQKAIEKGDISEAYIQQEKSMDLVVEKTRRTEEIIKRILETGIVSKKTKTTILLGEKQEEISVKRLEEMMKNFCDGIFLTDVIKLNLIYTAYISENEMSTWSDELISRLDFTTNDIIGISTINFQNFKRFYDLGIIKKDDIRGILEAIYIDESEGLLEQTTGDENRDTLLKNNSKNLLKNLYNSGIINEEDIKQYFEEGIITERMIESLEEGKSQEELQEFYKRMSKSFDNKMLLNQYKQYIEAYVEFIKFQAEHPEKVEELENLKNNLNKLRIQKEQYRGIFCKYNSYLSESEKHILGDELLTTYYIELGIEDDEMLQETIKVLYEDGLIDLENIIELDKKYITPMLDTLSLEDASKIRKSLNDRELEELIDNIFRDQSFSDERRFIVIMNLVGEDSEYDKMIREYYLSLLEFDNDSERKSKTKGTRGKRTGEGSKESKKYIYPDFVKWKFYKGLDKDVRVTRYSNGFVEFASSKLGVRIIEKYYDGDKPAYGTATYIMSEQDYRQNQSDLITITSKGSILESATLREITPKKDRIAHRTQSTDRTWMDDIVKYFDIDYEREKDSRYSKEELEKLQSIVKKYKTEYELIQE